MVPLPCLPPSSGPRASAHRQLEAQHPPEPAGTLRSGGGPQLRNLGVGPWHCGAKEDPPYLGGPTVGTVKGPSSLCYGRGWGNGNQTQSAGAGRGQGTGFLVAQLPWG